MVFDARADNLVEFIDRIANDIGATSDDPAGTAPRNTIAAGSTPAPTTASGSPTASSTAITGILTAARADFEDVNRAQRGLNTALGAAGSAVPGGAQNSAHDHLERPRNGWLMPSHLATMGFYILRVRSNLVEIRLVLDR